MVAGDIEGDSVMSWVKTLLADAFYWTDNDLVVQTRSMYGGTPRERGGASFLLDQGGKAVGICGKDANLMIAKRIVDTSVPMSLLADHPDLRGIEVYACGSVRMVQAAVPDLLAHGLDEKFCFSDAFVASVGGTAGPKETVVKR